MSDEARRSAAVVDALGRSMASDQQVVIRPAIACFELRALSGPPVSGAIFEIQLTLRPETYPFVVLDGTISGDICSAINMRWRVTGGAFGPDLALHAELTPLAGGIAEMVTGVSDCRSKTVDISGTFQVPDSYVGAYGFDGDPFDFPHVTLFKGWQACS
jgi:hypothetical protein